MVSEAEKVFKLKQEERNLIIVKDIIGDMERYIDNKDFKKAHITCGVRSNIITSIEVTDGFVHDSNMFRSLVDNTFKHFDMKEVYADKAYSSRENLGIVSKCGAIPFIPFKKNTKRSTKGVPIWSTMYNYFKYNKDIFLEHYHKHSNVNHNINFSTK